MSPAAWLSTRVALPSGDGTILPAPKSALIVVPVIWFLLASMTCTIPARKFVTNTRSLTWLKFGLVDVLLPLLPPPQAHQVNTTEHNTSKKAERFNRELPRLALNAETPSIAERYHWSRSSYGPNPCYRLTSGPLENSCLAPF